MLKNRRIEVFTSTPTTLMPPTTLTTLTAVMTLTTMTAPILLLRKLEPHKL